MALGRACGSCPWFLMFVALSCLTDLVQCLIGAGPPDYHCDQQPAGAYDPIHIRNAAGTLEATFIRYGGTLTHLVHKGSAAVGPIDVVLGWDDARQYCASPMHTYFGATVGRVANRIANGTFEFEGHKYVLDRNEKDYDTLHGGWQGFDRRVFDVVHLSDSSVTLSYVSFDGEEGFPGTLQVRVTHSISDDGTWQLQYRAVADRDTVVSLTNHAYFNLNGNVLNTPTVLEHVMHIPDGDRFVEVDAHLIPTGAVKSVETASFLDYRSPKVLGKDIDRGTVTPQGGYDNAWVIRPEALGASAGARPRLFLELYTPLTGIGMRVYTDQPSLQIYSGNFLNGTNPATRIPRKRSQSFGPDPQYYQWRGALALEAQQYPDSVNHANFPSIALKMGELYEQSTSYQLFDREPNAGGFVV